MIRLCLHQILDFMDIRKKLKYLYVIKTQYNNMRRRMNLSSPPKCCIDPPNAKNLKLKSTTNDTSISTKMDFSRRVLLQRCVIRYTPPPFL